MHVRKIILLLLAVTVICSKAFTQRYNFISYNTDEGLPQSQVFGLAQSGDRQIWISTYAGISRFDGKTFTNFTTSEGLAANYTIQFILDQQQRVWAITKSNLNLIEGNKVYTYPLPETIADNRVRLAVTDDNILWCLINGTLYSLRQEKFVKTAIPGFPENAFLSLLPGEKKTTFLMAPERTLYKYHAGAWEKFTALALPDPASRIYNIYIDSADDIWILTRNALLVKHPSSPEIRTWFSTSDKHVILTSLTKDQSGNFWVGGTGGAYKIRQDGSYLHFDQANGFSDYRVNDILSDLEGNIWLGTNGDGIMKYCGGIFTSFENDGNAGDSKAEFVTNDRRGNLFFGNTGNDFCIYNGRTRKFPLRKTVLKDDEIINAFTDSMDRTWICSLGGGIWKYEKGILTATAFNKGSVGQIYEDGGKTFFCTADGLIISEKDKLFKKPGFSEFAFCVIAAGKDSLLVAQHNGLVLLKDTIKLNYPFPADLQKTTICAFERWKDKIFIGTIGNGIFIWDRATGHFRQLDMAKGLGSNLIYSLKFDSSGRLWAGTGKGVTRIGSADDFSTMSIRNYGKEQGFSGKECNSNAIALLPDGTVWFGTAKGLYCYHPGEDREAHILPKLSLGSVKVGDSVLPSLPASLVLSADKSRVSLEFRAITYSRNDIRYSYFLQGLEDNFSAPDLKDFVVYPSLPPGQYIFNVKATDEEGHQLGETLSYPLSVRPAFYQTPWFKLLLALVFAGSLLLIYRIRKNHLYKQKMLIEAMRGEEQRKIRKKTAQDFHDEMGNKLARIMVLSDILKTKLPANEEAQGLAIKIQDNVTWLHQGTKDIIWSLNPDNDNLHFLVKHISHFGVDLFLDTDIEFSAIPVNDEFKQFFLPMDYARNIIMICKEVFTNILKHSQCSRVGTEVILTGLNTVRLTIMDNGKGLNGKTNPNGNGLINIRQRAASLGAELELRSEHGKGTLVALNFTLPRNRI